MRGHSKGHYFRERERERGAGEGPVPEVEPDIQYTGLLGQPVLHRAPGTPNRKTGRRRPTEEHYFVDWLRHGTGVRVRSRDARPS